MTLPLPDLDGRRWADLVEEALARLPRYAPEWTDYNAHDPGITIAELLAYTAEQSLYRANRVTERLLRAFLRLAGPGAEPAGPRPARVPLAFRLPAGSDPVRLPAGLILVPEPAESARSDRADAPLLQADDPFAAPVRLLHDLVVWPAQIRSLQSADGQGHFTDLTRPRAGASSFFPWGDDPSPSANGPALVIGLDPPLPPGASFSIRLDLASPDPDGRREAVRAELDRRHTLARSSPRTPVSDAAPPRPWTGLPGDDAERAPMPPDDSPPSRVTWEYYEPELLGWRALDACDPTRGLTLDGTIDLAFPDASADEAAGPGFVRDRGFRAGSYQYIRCRLAEGRPDSAPRVARIEIHAAMVEQSVPAMTHLGGVPPGNDDPSRCVCLEELAPILAEAPVTRGPADADRIAAATEVAARRGAAAGWIVPAEISGPTAPEPDGSTRVVLSASTIVAGSLRLVTLEPAGDRGARGYILRAWEVAGEPVAERSAAARATFDAESGELRFGDGRRGRAVPRGSLVIAAYDETLAARGNPPPRRRYFLPGLTAPRVPLTQPEYDRLVGLIAWNQGLCGATPACRPPAGLTAYSGDRLDGDIARAGADAEALADALPRLVRTTGSASALSAEAAKHGSTIDGAEAEDVARLLPPSSAVVGADFERLARETPGSAVLRARAFEATDPRYPGISAPGGVTLVVLPELPLGKPEPTAGLLSRVASYLRGLRIVGTRLAVVGPDYVPISLTAAIAVAPGRSSADVTARAEAALRAWLDPLRWPFGLAPTAAEVLARLAAVEGVSGASGVRLGVPPWPKAPWALPYWDRLQLEPSGTGPRGRRRLEASGAISS